MASSSIDAAGHASRFADASARAEAILDMVPGDDTRVTQLQADLTLRWNTLVNALEELEIAIIAINRELVAEAPSAVAPYCS